MPPAESAPRDRTSSIVWISLAAIAAVLVIFMSCERGNEAANHPAIGRQLSLVQLEPLTGEAKAISAAELRGKVTLINFWGPWCEHCLDEMPHLIRLRETFGKRDDVQFLFVSCSPDWRPNTPPVLQWSEKLPQLKSHTADLLAARGWSIATHSDPHGKTRQAFAGLDAWDGYPTTLLVDRDGVIRYVAIGYSPGDEHVIEEELRKTIAAPPGVRGTYDSGGQLAR